MTPGEFIKAGQRLHGRKKWKSALARALGVDVSTVHRMTQRDASTAAFKRAQVPGPYEIAVKAMLENKRARDKLDAAARKLLPRKFRKRKTPRKPRAATRVTKRPATLPAPVTVQLDDDVGDPC